MINYMDQLKGFVDDIDVRDNGVAGILVTSMFLGTNDESVGIGLRAIEDGFLLNDCRAVTDVWEIDDVDVAALQSKIDAVCDKFGVYFEDRHLWMKVEYCDGGHRLHKAIWRFLQAISILGNIDCGL